MISRKRWWRRMSRRSQAISRSGTILTSPLSTELAGKRSRRTSEPNPWLATSRVGDPSRALLESARNRSGKALKFLGPHLQRTFATERHFAISERFAPAHYRRRLSSSSSNCWLVVITRLLPRYWVLARTNSTRSRPMSVLLSSKAPPITLPIPLSPGAP